jgi:hypothetical protein
MTLNKKSLLISLIASGFSVSSFGASISKNAVIPLDDYEYTDAENSATLKGGYAVKKDDFTKYSFNKPFFITTQHRVEYQNIDEGITKNTTDIKSLIDCKEQRYAVQSEGKKVHFNGNTPPLSSWRTMNESAQVYKKICSQTKGFDKNHSPKKDHLKGWKFFAFNSNFVYVNLDDIAKGSSDQPFTIRSKRFDSSFNKAKYNVSSVIDEITLDCKNSKFNLLKSTHYSDDFEYQPNPNSKAVNFETYEENWHELSTEIKEGLGICK